MAVNKIKRRGGGSRVSCASFEEEDGTSRIFTRSARDRRTRASGPNDDDIVGFCPQSTPRSFMSAMASWS